MGNGNNHLYFISTKVLGLGDERRHTCIVYIYYKENDKKLQFSPFFKKDRFKVLITKLIKSITNN